VEVVKLVKLEVSVELGVWENLTSFWTFSTVRSESYLHEGGGHQISDPNFWKFRRSRQSKLTKTILYLLQNLGSFHWGEHTSKKIFQNGCVTLDSHSSIS